MDSQKKGKTDMKRKLLAVVGGTMLLGSYVILAQRGGAPAQPQPMGFFITSVGVGDGANLGGLAGADRHCQALAMAAGAGNRTWHAYLSTSGPGAVNARDRIGAGPWYNQKGQIIAMNVADLHGDVQRDRNSINKEYALNEKGATVNGRGDTPNTHDILTGSDSLGRSLPGDPAVTTCNNWTSNGAGVRGADGMSPRTMLGHHDRSGGGNSSWNSAHASQGCSQQNLVATGGAGLFYCFATN
jgi:hypothetical protein